MSFLELNGLTIPVMEGGSDRVINIGQRERAFDGTYLSTRRARKRRWSYTTKPLVEMDAKAVEGVVAGLGHSFGFDFDDAANLTHDKYSAKGLAPSPAIYSPVFGIAADGDPVTDLDDVTESKYGAGAMIAEIATTNLLTQNQADVETDTTGFAGVAGGAVAVNTANYVQGAQSLLITTSAANDGAATTTVGVSASTAYAASVYLKCASNRNITVELIDNIGGAGSPIGTTSDNLVADTWKRVTVTGTTNAGATIANIRVIDTDAGGTQIFADAWQLEQNSAATHWQTPATARTVADLEYPATFLNAASDVTISFWVKSPTASPASNAYYVALYSGTSNIVAVYRLSAGSLRFRLRGTGTNDITEASPGFDGDWHMITAVARSNAETGENEQELYIDGSSVESSNPGDPTDWSTIDAIRVGHQASTLFTDSPIDDLQVLPWAATASQISAWYSMGTAMPASPRANLTGDIIPEDLAIVDGEVNSITRHAGYDSGNFKTNLSRIAFELHEV